MLLEVRDHDNQQRQFRQRGFGPAHADRFVAERVLEGADYIKVIVEDPRRMGNAALDVATIAALVKVAHQAVLKVIAHVTTLVALMNAAEAGVDILTHAPVDADVDDDLAQSLSTRVLGCTDVNHYVCRGEVRQNASMNAMALPHPARRMLDKYASGIHRVGLNNPGWD